LFEYLTEMSGVRREKIAALGRIDAVEVCCYYEVRFPSRVGR